MILGTAPYMSPEQVEGHNVDQRSDIFSVGIVFFEMATGKRPFHGQSSMSLLSSILKDEPPSVSELKPNLPESLSSIVRRCLAKDPDARYQNGEELHLEIRDVSRDGAPTDAAIAPAKVTCLACGHKNRANAKFCEQSAGSPSPVHARAAAPSFVRRPSSATSVGQRRPRSHACTPLSTLPARSLKRSPPSRASASKSRFCSSASKARWISHNGGCRRVAPDPGSFLRDSRGGSTPLRG